MDSFGTWDYDGDFPWETEDEEWLEDGALLGNVVEALVLAHGHGGLCGLMEHSLQQNGARRQKEIKCFFEQ